VVRGDAYAFKELADRAYGRHKEVREYEIHPDHNLSDADLRARVAELERKLGYSSSEPESIADSRRNQAQLA
jgi:hypothetical protein